MSGFRKTCDCGRVPINADGRCATCEDERTYADAVVWLRDLDGTGSMHPCAPHDPGAIRYIREDLI